MATITVDDIRSLMDNPQLIRNISLIAYVDHGKATLSDSLISATGIIVHRRTSERFNDARPTSWTHVTIKSPSVPLRYHMKSPLDGFPSQDYLINLIDCHTHVDSSSVSEIIAALRVADGALVVVDCVEGYRLNVESVLRHALSERIKSVLMINKLDRVFLELQLSPEDAYQCFCRHIESVNEVIATHSDPILGDFLVDPAKGTVAFGSGLQCWGFTLTTFARMYAKKFSIDEKKLMSRLWGDNYFDAARRAWTTSPIDAQGKPLRRGFCQFILDPIYHICDAITNNKKDKLEKICASIGLTLSQDDMQLSPRKLFKSVMSKFLPISDSLLEMVVIHLPSPKMAQSYRADSLYSGPLDDKYFKAIKECDPTGPLVVYVPRIVPSSDASHFFAFGRVFAGTVSTGQKVRIMGPNYEPGREDDLRIKFIQRTVLMLGRYTESIESAACGSIVGLELELAGADRGLFKASTIADEESDDCHVLTAKQKGT